MRERVMQFMMVLLSLFLVGCGGSTPKESELIDEAYNAGNGIQYKDARIYYEDGIRYISLNSDSTVIDKTVSFATTTDKKVSFVTAGLPMTTVTASASVEGKDINSTIQGKIALEKYFFPITTYNIHIYDPSSQEKPFIGIYDELVEGHEYVILDMEYYQDQLVMKAERTFIFQNDGKGITLSLIIEPFELDIKIDDTYSSNINMDENFLYDENNGGYTYKGIVGKEYKIFGYAEEEYFLTFSYSRVYLYLLTGEFEILTTPDVLEEDVGTIGGVTWEHGYVDYEELHNKEYPLKTDELVEGNFLLSTIVENEVYLEFGGMISPTVTYSYKGSTDNWNGENIPEGASLYIDIDNDNLDGYIMLVDVDNIQDILDGLIGDEKGVKDDDGIVDDEEDGDTWDDDDEFSDLAP